ncbi:hypothetical protein ACMA1D_16205 [Streptomyces sp. 796.1]|uniref:hypothetical protein n=1 Tax=Streptomyces sp. 796.1 TaxID=3163029 RepID=UPI0039C9305A
MSGVGGDAVELDGGRAEAAAVVAQQNGAAEPTSARPSWYALPLRYEPAELGGLPLRRFLDALHAEGATEVDRPGSTCPLGTHPLFQHPGALLPGYAGHQSPAVRRFPVAEAVHATLLKLPVWHREADARLADAYTAAIAKVATHAKDLLL